jgi:hypothetical protein
MELVREFFEKDGHAFLAFLANLRYPLVAEYSGPASDSKCMFLWDIRDIPLFKKFLRLTANKKLMKIREHTKKDIRGLHQLKIYSCGHEYWLIFETDTRTLVQELKHICLFYLGGEENVQS